MNMTFEIFVYRAQLFAVKMQSRRKGWFVVLGQAFGGLITQFLMGLCFAKILAEGEKQWQKQRSAKFAKRK